MRFSISALLAILFFNSNQATAYPEMARSGYVNCNSCHISLNGGGILNDYGRKLSKEELAVWKIKDEKSKEEEFAYGILGDTPIQKYLKFGGDVRSVYYYVNTPDFESGKTILMQADFQAALVKNHWTVVAAAGASQEDSGENAKFLSRNHYAQYEINEFFRVRGGKFIPAYGITTPDHMTLTRDPIELGYNYESYNFEGSYLSEQWSFFATGIFGRPDDQDLDRDKGFALQAAYAINENIKFGLNTWYGKKKDLTSRWLYGGFVIAGLTEKLFASSEFDIKSYKDGDHGIASTQKISYTLTDGLWLYGLQEFGTTNIPLTYEGKMNVLGLGMQFFPRTHFEFNVAYERIMSNDIIGTTTQFTGMDAIWVMSHFYL